ncbi:gliding motility lipoprotein GldD [Emticicia sp. CRIBPO]|uniref:gliding motility lipoprotein GldD n=1 Tax=Emticicia sp. CRIBPO TaxID=2683258 RepID=UPI00141254F1|nr:gliding motility lipoprotein GldD [Emticicia sp. CRIBPO]NBA86208.1 gliding motility lipoprotein GldD [Emticicia sp. CRIBPO]
MRILPRVIHFILFSALIISCATGSSDYTPKPKGFNRIELPKHEYQQLTEDHPYTFQYSKHAIIQPDTVGQAEPHWIIVYYPELDARIQFTYKPLNGDTDKLDHHIADAYKLAYRHLVKANYKEEKKINLKNGKSAIVIELEGEVPSHFQFYLTDTTRHFLRGAVYLEQATMNDSLLPVINYLKKDCIHLMETLNWKNK